MGLLDQEAPLIAQEENEIADREIDNERLRSAKLSSDEEEDETLDSIDEEEDLNVE